MNADTLALIAGVVMSLAFSYIPGLKTWFGKLASERKQLTMGIVLVAVAGAILGLACAGVGGDLGIAVTCDRAGVLAFARVLILALIANQSTYLITKR